MPCKEEKAGVEKRSAPVKEEEEEEEEEGRRRLQKKIERLLRRNKMLPDENKK